MVSFFSGTESGHPTARKKHVEEETRGKNKEEEAEEEAIKSADTGARRASTFDNYR